MHSFGIWICGTASNFAFTEIVKLSNKCILGGDRWQPARGWGKTVKPVHIKEIRELYYEKDMAAIFPHWMARSGADLLMTGGFSPKQFFRYISEERSALDLVAVDGRVVFVCTRAPRRHPPADAPRSLAAPQRAICCLWPPCAPPPPPPLPRTLPRPRPFRRRLRSSGVHEVRGASKLQEEFKIKSTLPSSSCN